MMRALAGCLGLALAFCGARLAAGADAVTGTAEPNPKDPGLPATPASPAQTAAPSVAVPGDRAAAGPDPGGATLRAYQDALVAARLDASAPLGLEQLREAVAEAEARVALGRRDEAVSLLAALVESPRFAVLAALDEARAALYTLGDSLGRVGAYEAARGYLRRLIDPAKIDTWYRRALRSLVDFGLESGQSAVFLAELSRLPPAAGQSWAGDVLYLKGMLHESSGELEQALGAYAQIPDNSRFWSQANYRSGLIRVEGRQLSAGEAAFCKIADPKQTPRLAPLYGGNAFFQVRDLSRLALGRVAHEQYRFDDSRYYYHLVPGDSDHLPEALYEAATSRYEAKDYETAHGLLLELRSAGAHHVYADEAMILDAYVDLARCQFPRADKTLNEFLKRYEPVLQAARQLRQEPGSLRALLATTGTEARGAKGLGYPPEVTELLVTSIRIDASYGRVSRQLADLEHQLAGLDGTSAELAILMLRSRGPDAVKARPAAAVADTLKQRADRLFEQTAALRRLLREARGGEGAPAEELGALGQELLGVESAVLSFQAASRSESESVDAPPAAGLSGLLADDTALRRELDVRGQALKAALIERQSELAEEALSRLDLRLTRLVRRARAGRIETVLGRKRALEIEVEALSQGYLPRGAIDSLDAARYLSDDEEYWPYDGEDWDDEYVGGEGLR
jgi:hypothetical protein